MPAEVQRLERRLRKRDVRFLAALGSLAVVGTVAGVVGVARGSDPAGPATCITYAAPGVMGGGEWHLCGTQAHAFCTAHAVASRSLIEQCDRLRG
jgi:hypothetical protein